MKNASQYIIDIYHCDMYHSNFDKFGKLFF